MSKTPLRPFSTCMMVLLTALAAQSVEAKRIYQYRDAQGILHFTDRKPEEAGLAIKETKVDADPQKLVELIVNQVGDEHIVTVINRLGGPTQVTLSFVEATNVAADPPLPVDLVLGAYENRQAVRLHSIDPTQAGGFKLTHMALPGPPSRLERSEFAYGFPFSDRSRILLGQGFNGSFSHTDSQSKYAVDLGADEGTPVLAARGGVVMMVEQDFEGSGLDRNKFADRANSVRILHDDGTMGVYAHLAFESVLVAPGHRVNPGQTIGRAGSTGFSTGPHLHFVIQVNNGRDLVSIPFDFAGGMPPLAAGAPHSAAPAN